VARRRRKRRVGRIPSPEFGCDESGFNELSKTYKNSPSIENYVKLRRENPDAEIEVSVIGGMEQLFYMEGELRRYGIDPLLAASTMDADPVAISEISLQLMEKLIHGRKLAKSGSTHLVRRGLAVPDKLIDWLITCSLDALSWNNYLHIPRDLIVLIRERLGGSNPEYARASHAHEQKINAACIGGQLKAQGVTPTFKILGNILGVAPSTVKRWFEPGEFEREIERWSYLVDKTGRPDSFGKPKESPLRRKDTAQR
jgi:hypothetical protein